MATYSVSLKEKLNGLGMQGFQAGKFELAGKIFDKMMTGPEFPDFMTLVDLRVRRLTLVRA